MAAFVLSPHVADLGPRTGTHLDLFPGSAIPAVLPAGAPFWIGYGFVATPAGDSGDEPGGLGDDTHFDLDVDGNRVPTLCDVQLDREKAVRKTDVADFASGLPPGWHCFVGRWYDGGKLILSSRAAIEFVDA